MWFYAETNPSGLIRNLQYLEKSPTSQTTIFTTTARAVDSIFLVTNVQALTMCRRQYVQIRWYSIRSATDNRLLVIEQTGLTRYRHTGLPRYRHAGSPTRFQSGRPTLFHTGRPTLFHNGWATGLAVEVMVSMREKIEHTLYTTFEHDVSSYCILFRMKSSLDNKVSQYIGTWKVLKSFQVFRIL